MGHQYERTDPLLERDQICGERRGWLRYVDWCGTEFSRADKRNAVMTGLGPAADGNFAVYQMQTGGAWVKMQNDAQDQEDSRLTPAVSPDTGIPWVISLPFAPPAAQAGSQWP